MTHPQVGPKSPRISALYSDMVRRPPAAAQAPAPQGSPRVLTPLHGAMVGRPPTHAMALPRPPMRPFGPSGASPGRNARQLLLLLAQQLRLRHVKMMRAQNLPQLTHEDKGYCEKLLHLNRAFGDILTNTYNFTMNLEHLHEDMARLLEAHLQHGRALLGSPALVMTNNPSYKSFTAPEGERPAPVLLKVPLHNHDTWLPTGHKLLHAIATHCPLPAITGQVAHFYSVMADLAEARQSASEHETLKRMFGEVAKNWRDYSAAIDHREAQTTAQAPGSSVPSASPDR